MVSDVHPTGTGTATAVPVLRPGRERDVDAFFALAKIAGPGFTNLPPDRAALQAKLAASERALSDEAARQAGASIIFLIEAEGRVVGTSCVIPRLGVEWPFYSYRYTRQTRHSRDLGTSKSQLLLNLVNDFEGEAEAGGLFIDPAWRGRGIGALAARGRYFFIACHRSWFGRRIIAELRGWQDSNGGSPVWDAIGRQFYDMEFDEADRLGALRGNQFIADLGPRYPLYVSMLPDDARRALGRPHDDGRAAHAMLLEEGFVDGEYVDIFDGGPTLVADIDQLRTVRGLRHVTLRGAGSSGGSAIVATGEGHAFRAAIGPAPTDGRLDPALISALNVEIGDSICAVQG